MALLLQIESWFTLGFLGFTRFQLFCLHKKFSKSNAYDNVALHQPDDTVWSDLAYSKYPTKGFCNGDQVFTGLDIGSLESRNMHEYYTKSI